MDTSALPVVPKSDDSRNTSAFDINEKDEKSSPSTSTPQLTVPELGDETLDRRVWRKLDVRLIPVLIMFYLLSFLDRTNLGNARIAGLQGDLHMTNKQYSIALTVTYIPYILSELPSNLIIKALGPDRVLPTMLTLWGVVTATQGVVHNYGGLLACRFFLGLLEGGLFPGLVLYLSFFYPRAKMQMRIASIFAASTLAGAFSGILAYGIVQIPTNRPVWVWIFIIEGVFTTVCGLVSFFMLPRDPHTAKFLSEEEKSHIDACVYGDREAAKAAAAEKFDWKEVGIAFTDLHVLNLGILSFLSGTIIFSLAYFTPSIVQSLGYTGAEAQLFTVPPYAVAFVLAVASAYISDRYRCRGYVAIVTGVLCVIGFSMFLTAESTKVRYGSLFFTIPGSYASSPTLTAWMSNNSTPHIRRATAIAIAAISTNIGGILSTWLLGYVSHPPRYTSGTGILLGFSAAMTIVAAVNVAWLTAKNNKKAIIRATMKKEDEAPGLGDKSAWFIYNL